MAILSPNRRAARLSRGTSAHKSLRILALLAVSGLLTGCGMVVMDPSGDVAVQQRNLIIASTALMLLVILPVIALTFIFAWRYRASNTDATYDPDFHHSTQLEVVIWTVPLLIIIALGAMTWVSTHTLDPYRPLSRLAPNKPVPADVKPLTVEVVALDWKWLFIYPEYGVASVNEMAAPANVPISFRITSSSVWNTFYVPALAGMIYAMPGMETKLHAVMNEEGEFTGLSGHVQRIGLLPHELRLPKPHPAGLRRVGGEGEGRRNAPRPRGLSQAREAERGGAGPLFRVGGERPLRRRCSACASRPGQMCVHEMHHIDRMGGAAGTARRTASGSTTTAAGWRAATSRPAPPSPPPAARRGVSEEPEGVMPRDAAR